ncbi:MAG TPA: hypothetical protein VHB21_17020 [Minicystis sp.]|nr:hypothetical protein [Minicystis sp.]
MAIVRGLAAALAVVFAVSLASSTGCNDDETVNPLTSASSSGGAGGASTTGPTGSGGATSAGGAGGTISAAGGGGAGGAACLGAALYADLFSIADDALCATALYEGDGAFDFHTTAIAFGAQGGPVILEPSTTSGSVDVSRYAPTPGQPKGSFTVATHTVAAQIPHGAFLGPQALDLGFFGWTAIGYSGAFPDTAGEVVLLAGDAVAARYPVNGPFAFGAVVDDADRGRLLYTGLSKLDDAAADVNGLYAADSCGTSTSSPSLEPDGSGACPPPTEVSAWGDASGPVAVDALGDAFAVMASFTGDQEARGFAHAAIARGEPPTDGTTMFTMPGFGSALAAIAPTPVDDGILAFQPSDGTTFQALDVVGQRYHLASGALATSGTPAPLLHFAAADTAVSMATDSSSRLWVAATRGSGPTAKLVFVVIARKP